MKKEKQGFIYILTNKYNNVLCTGATNDLIRRIYEHKNKIIKGFSYKYNLYKLVHYEILTDIFEAYEREKQIKASSRQNKINLINKFNPSWRDLYYDL